MKSNEHMHKHSAQQGVSEEEALKQGLDAKAKEFLEKGAEIYVKAYISTAGEGNE